MTPEERLQQHLTMMRGEPIMPLSGMQAITQAMRLRHAGLTYRSISTVMRVYHGAERTEGGWRHHLREHGAPAKHHPHSLRLAPQQHREDRS